MRSLLSLLSRLAVCWSGLLGESGAAPFPQRAIWLHQTHTDANLSISFTLFFFVGGVVPKDHFTAAVDSGLVQLKARVRLALRPPDRLVGVSTSLLSLVGLCSCNVRAVLSNGNQAIMLHMGKSDRCRGFTPLVLSRGQRSQCSQGMVK